MPGINKPVFMIYGKSLQHESLKGEYTLDTQIAPREEATSETMQANARISTSCFNSDQAVRVKDRLD